MSDVSSNSMLLRRSDMFYNITKCAHTHISHMHTHTYITDVYIHVTDVYTHTYVTDVYIHTSPMYVHTYAQTEVREVEREGKRK